MDDTERILIAGGGIGGLTAGLALMQAGFSVQILEQAPVLGEVGAGLTLSAGAMRSLDVLGQAEQLDSSVARVDEFPFLHFRSGRKLAASTGGRAVDGLPAHLRPGHTFRADLHALLAKAVGDLDPGCIVLGARVESVHQTTSSVAVRLADGSTVAGDVLIGCDGVRSQIRADLFGPEDPRFTGRVAYRFLLPSDVAAPFMGAGPAAVYIGPGKTFNRYLIARGQVLNCVGLVTADDWVAEGWSHRASVESLVAEFDGWHPDLVEILRRADPATLFRWGIFDRAPRTSWSSGRVTLLGDAAHPMLPFLGLGAAMAIEDGVVMGRAFAQAGDVAEAFALYESERLPRTTQVHRASAAQAQIFDSTDPEHYPPADAPAHDRGLSDYDPLIPLSV